MADPLTEKTRIQLTPENVRHGDSLSPQFFSKLRFPGYEVLGVLGSGGAGVVLQARQVQLSRVVALKLFIPQEHNHAPSIEAMLIEARSLAKLNHPNIVQIYDVGNAEGQFFLAMEFVDGGTLARHCAGACQPVSQAALIVETLARAVQVAHERGIVHRDLKPGNILLTREGSPKIADFGLAHLISDHPLSGTQPTISGTPSYMSPEQFLGTDTLNGPGTDIYALGVVLYELLVGRPPFRGSSLPEMLKLVTTSEIISPRQLRKDLPRDLEAICHKCLRREPERRYASAHELADDLRRFQMGEPVSARKLASSVRLWRWFRRHPRQLRLAALFLVVGIAVAELEYFGYGIVRRRSPVSAPLLPMTDSAPTRPYRLALTMSGDSSQRPDGEVIELEFAGDRYWSGRYLLEPGVNSTQKSMAHAYTILGPSMGKIQAVYLSRQAAEPPCPSWYVTLQVVDLVDQQAWNFQGSNWRLLTGQSGRCVCKLDATQAMSQAK